MACARFPGCCHHVDDVVHLSVCCSARRLFHLCFHTVSSIKRFIPPLLSVHARLCKAVVHDAEGSHPSREPILTRAGAGLTRVPDGHLRELLLHNSQVDLQAWKRHKRVNRGDNAQIVECNNARVVWSLKILQADSWQSEPLHHPRCTWREPYSILSEIAENLWCLAPFLWDSVTNSNSR